MKFAYYPGCSLEHSAVEYDTSTRAVMKALGAELVDIPDWTCCGASAAQAVDEMAGLVLAARNVALAGKHHPGSDILAPCSACYLNLLDVVEKAAADRNLLEEINGVLSRQGLALDPNARVRHLVDVLANDLAGEMENRVAKSLEGMTLALYYGCQILRPYQKFDDPEHPVSMEAVIRATGAEVHSWDMGGKCCGASLMATHQSAAVDCVARILRAARGADAIVTVCPMCEMNLEGYQHKTLGAAGLKMPVSVLYLPQLLGLALGLDARDVDISKNLSVAPGLADRLTKVKDAPMGA